MSRFFTEEEVEGLVIHNEVASEQLSDGGLTAFMETIVVADYDGKHYRLYWLRGLTAMQEDFFWEQEATEVHKVKKVIEVEQWEAVSE